MPRRIPEFCYDLHGQRPPRSFIPHVALRIEHDGVEAQFDAAMLLDTGATSDVTFSKASQKTILSHLGENFTWAGARYRVGPLSLLHQRLSYSHEHLIHSPIEAEGGLLREVRNLRKGTRDANTMSLAYFVQAGRGIHLDPDGANEKAITEYYGVHNDGPRPIFSTDLKFPASIPTLRHSMLAFSAERDLYLETSLEGPSGSLTHPICWDTGAEVCTVPARLLQGLGVRDQVVDKISLRSTGGSIVSFLNVPVDDDYDEVIMGATLFSLCSFAIKPQGAGAFGLTVLQPAAAINQVEVDH